MISSAKYGVKFLLSLLFTFVICLSSIAQNHEAPSLQIGLDGLTFSKGTLDHELILSIISEKQDELKLKQIQNMFLKELNQASGTVYLFADNVLSSLILEKDVEIRSKRLMEHVVNLGFSGAFAQYYYTEFFDQNIDPSVFYDCEPGLLPDDKISGFGRVGNLNFTLILDISTDIMRSNPTLENLGLGNIGNEGSYYSYSRYYSLLSEYRGKEEKLSAKLTENRTKLAQLNMQLMEDPVRGFMEGRIENQENELLLVQNKIAQLENLKHEMTKVMESLLEYIGVLAYCKTLFNSDFSMSRISELQNVISYGNDCKLGNMELEAIEEELIQIFQDNIEDLNEEQLDLFTNIIQDFAQFQFKRNYYDSDVEYISDVVYKIQFEIFPKLDKIIGVDPGLIEVKISLINCLKGTASDLLENLEDLAMSQINPDSKIYKIYFLVSSLYDFDQNTTFSEYLNFLNNIPDLIDDPKIRNTISTVISFVSNYVELETNDEGEEYLEVKVESVLLHLKEKSLNYNSNFKMTLTVGTNSTFFLNDGGFENRLNDSTNLNLSNFSFVGEKIGLKFKIYDWNYVYGQEKHNKFKYYGINYTRIVPPKEPVISDIHLNLYGSGILYSITNLSTEGEFTDPLVGLGLGITFFNDLEFNASYGQVITTKRPMVWNENHFFNIGFDIQLFEYLNRLNEKRKMNKYNEQKLEYGLDQADR